MGTVLQQPIAVQPGSGKKLNNLGVTHLLTGAQTGGSYYLCEAIFGPESGSPMHIHHHEDEVIHVLEGTIDIRFGEGDLHIPEGGTVHLPRGVAHALYNPLKTRLKLMVHTIPAGLEKYFDEVDTAIQEGTLNNEVHAQISAKYGLEWLD
jgi:mannose-6-phosphate isomerase-like protein (cupin superfamily)